MRRARFIFIMVLPAILFPMIFTYYPMIKGSLMAFQSYNLMNVKNIKWVGLENFSKLFAHNTSNTFYSTMLNTVKWVGISLFVQFTVGFAMALLLKKKFKGSSLYQGLIFFPWAVSGFIIGIMWRWMFNGTSGVINDLLMRIHLISQPVGWLASKNTALYSCIIANIWYGIPFFTIMITAALRGVSEDLYEAADVDGATRMQKILHITLPALKPTIMILLILAIGGVLNTGYERQLLMSNDAILNYSDVLDTYAYRYGLKNGMYSYGTAVGFFKSAVSFILVISANALSKKFSDDNTALF